jgi:fluoride exporter
MMRVFLVGAGGFLGSILRYAVGGWVHNLSNNAWFPYGTLVVNSVGCLLIGFLSGLAENRSVFGPEVRLFLFIGAWRLHDLLVVCVRNLFARARH